MRNVFLILLCLSYGVQRAQQLQKRAVRFGIKTGLVLTNITGTGVETTLKKGFEGGLWLQLKLRKNWTAQFEILFTEKGTGSHPGSKLNKYANSYWIDLYYFEVPVLVQYHQNDFFFEFGPSLGYLASSAEASHGAAGNSNSMNVPQFNSREVSFNFGIGYAFFGSWNFGCRYVNSILPIRAKFSSQGSTQRNLYNHVFAITLAHQIKVKAPDKHQPLLEILNE